MDVVTLLLAKKYVDESLAGIGALRGKSAYEVALDNGFIGSEQEWVESLKGTTPHIGENGNWFIDDFDTGVVAAPDLAGYATEEFVNTELEKLDLTSYVTKEELTEEIQNIEIPDVSNFATKIEVEEAISSIDLNLYATKEELQDAIEDIADDIDLSAYALKTDIPSLEGLATESYVQGIIEDLPQFDLTDYAKKSDITGLASEEWVQQQLEGIECGSVEEVVEF